MTDEDTREFTTEELAAAGNAATDDPEVLAEKAIDDVDLDEFEEDESDDAEEDD